MKVEFQTGHVGLNVRDLDVSGRFYRSVFGFQEMHRSDAADRRFLFLGDNGKVILTLWQQSNGSFEKNRAGLHHLSFQVGSMKEVQEIENRLREKNTSLLYEGIVPHLEGSASGGLFFEDPDGIRLEVYAPQGAEQYHAPHSDAPSCGFF